MSTKCINSPKTFNSCFIINAFFLALYITHISFVLNFFPDTDCYTEDSFVKLNAIVYIFLNRFQQ